MKIKYITLFICSLVLCLTGGAIYALSETSVVNRLDTGVVDIQLSEYEQLADGSEVIFNGAKDVLPGMDVSLMPRIYNEGASCYVRMKPNFINIPQLSDDNLIGLDDHWIKCLDGYYYYKDVIDPLETIQIFHGLHIPEDLDEDMKKRTFQLHLQLDAIQSSNFYPDFQQDHPWGQVEIIECIQSGPYDIRVMTMDGSGLQVVYQGESKSLIAAPKDFFSGFSTMLPGDTYTGTIELFNDGDEERTLYFRTKSLDDSPLLEHIELEITTEIDNKKNLIYLGPLHGEELNENIDLAYLQAGMSGVMHFKLYVPTYLDNKFTLMDTHIKWIFSTLNMPKTSDSVKTGDYENVGLLFMIWGATLMISISVLTIKKFNKKLRKE